MRYVKRVLTLCLALGLLTAFGPLAAAAADTADTTIIYLRIEGIYETLYDGDFVVNGTAPSLRLALTEFSDSRVGPRVEGLEEGYINSVAGDKAATFGGWDGWLFRINNKEPIAGIDGVTLQDGDAVLLYYGDPYGVGMQFPEFDDSYVEEGILRFTSLDTTYDENAKPVQSRNPVAGATLWWGAQRYETDENGCVALQSKYDIYTHVPLQIEKTAENGLPLVLRFPPEHYLDLPFNAKEPNPATGDINPVALVICVVVGIGAVVLFLRSSKTKR